MVNVKKTPLTKRGTNMKLGTSSSKGYHTVLCVSPVPAEVLKCSECDESLNIKSINYKKVERY
jgi:hypothetical protein